jgi:protein-tyrosine phosphatase
MPTADDKIFRVMFVCTGNTCRSPMAEGILRRMAKEDNLEYMDVVSSGVGTLDGYPATGHAIRVAQKDGVDISNHHSLQLIAELMEEADLIFALAFDHYEKMLMMYPEDENKIHMLKGFPYNQAEKGLNIADPIGLDFKEYQKTYNAIKAELERIWPNIKEWYKRKIKD